jgi:pimeloyl-ACP methyl ester carboxylesterase
MLTERSFDAGTLSLNYAEEPAAGPPLVLLHGASGCWQTFLPIIPFVGWRWHLYAPDFRGHGRSGRVGGTYRLGDFAQDTTRFLREVVREPAVLLGFSLGAVVATQVAAESPDAVRAVVLEDPGFAGAPLAAMAGGRIAAQAVMVRELL